MYDILMNEGMREQEYLVGSALLERNGHLSWFTVRSLKSLLLYYDCRIAFIIEARAECS